MTTLDALGRRHAKLLAELEEVRAALVPAIRAEREAGATHVELMQRSGYTSLETIRQILRPETRDAIRTRRRVS